VHSLQPWPLAFARPNASRLSATLKARMTLLRLQTRVIESLDDLSNGMNAGLLSPTEWHNEVVQVLLVGHTAAYLEGRGVRDLTPDARRLIAAVVAEQVEYLGRFTDQIDAEGWQDSRMRSRLRLYAGPLKTTYERGRTFGLDLPFMPGEGSECMVNCRCSWRIAWLDQEELNADCFWTLHQAEHCPTCLARAADNPYRVRGGRLVR